MRDDLRGKSKVYCVHGILVLLSLTLLGCDSHIEQAEKAITPKTTHVDETPDASHHTNLWQVAGQATMPKKIQQHSQATEQNKKLTEEEKAIVGRYSVVVPCTDPIARCGDEKEDAVEFILNLMPDGSVYRLIKRLGSIQVDSRSSQSYYKDHWELKQINAQQYIVTFYSSNGMKFFYRIDDNKRLVMDLGRNKLINLQAYRTGYPFPDRAYTLSKLPD
ncbi:hypothetical protein [Acinetobacter boissieri]|uniref:NlpE N-terminal domain-containing protein n=1 Tax=Acinetobacter boissieri TaxID=1219383 RepID=A0A1G6HYU2_9GAMM|nr:hypothetical protein [Acinetobacter boissieri]SDB98995.1 hypothetical protein SAMN05421733_107103 [Acinetobacter boissieri]